MPFIPSSANAGVGDLRLVRLSSPEQVSAKEACDDHDSEYGELPHLLLPFLPPIIIGKGPRSRMLLPRTCRCLCLPLFGCLSGRLPFFFDLLNSDLASLLELVDSGRSFGYPQDILPIPIQQASASTINRLSIKPIGLLLFDFSA